jgi:hypothetical protein
MSDDLKSSVVSILNASGQIVGAGFVAGPRLVLTCAHVAAQAGSGPEGQPLLRQIAAANSPLPLRSLATGEGVASLMGVGAALDRLARHRVLTHTVDGCTVEVPLVRRWVNERAPLAGG